MVRLDGIRRERLKTELNNRLESFLKTRKIKAELESAVPVVDHAPCPEPEPGGATALGRSWEAVTG